MTDSSVVLAAIETSLAQIQESQELITQLGEPHLDESLQDLHTRLLVTRSVMSRVSNLLGSLVRIRARAKGSLIDAEGVLETANANTVDKPTFGHANFASGDERKAKLASATIQERYNVRQGEKLLSDIDAALEYGRIRHRELDRAVRDIDLRLKLITFEPNVS